METKNLEYFCFEQSLLNESSADKYSLTKDKLNIWFNFPRPLRYIHLLRFDKHLVNLTGVFLALVWPPFMIAKFLLEMFKLKISKSEILIKESSNDIILLFTRTALKRYQILKPKVQNYQVVSSSELSYINISDRVKILFKAIYFSFKFILKHPENIFQTYVSFQYLIFYNGLKQLNLKDKNVYFSNHYDRFATTIDILINSKSKNLIQHGLVPHDIFPSYRLKNISNIWYIRELDIESWRNNLLDHSQTNFYEQAPILELNKKIVENYEHSILLINQPDNINMEISLLMELLERFPNYEFFYKLHPLYLKSINLPEKITNSKIKIIKDATYPDVKFVIHKLSALGYEYEQLNKKVLIFNNKEEIVAELEKHFTKSIK